MGEAPSTSELSTMVALIKCFVLPGRGPVDKRQPLHLSDRFIFTRKQFVQRHFPPTRRARFDGAT